MQAARAALSAPCEAQNSSATQTVQLDNCNRFMDNEWTASLRLMHVQSGLFVQSHYARVSA